MFYLIEILKFDSVLEILYLNKDKTALNLKDIQMRAPFKMSVEEVTRVLDKLRTDNLLIRIDKDNPEFFLNYKGVKFYQCGGYLKDTFRNVLKKAFKVLVVALGVISTLIGVVLGVRELF